MRRRLAAVLVTILATVAGTFTVAPAVGATPEARALTHQCVDNNEWNNFDINDTRAYVHRLFDIVGYFRWQHGRFQKRVYAHCGAVYDRVSIVYRWNGASWRVYRARRD